MRKRIQNWHTNEQKSDMKELAKAFKALSDESRLRILSLLFKSGELCVCDIESTTGFTQTKVSRHLSYLTKARLIEGRKQGLWMLYKIAKPKNDDHAILLNCVRGILETNDVATRDLKKLTTNIDKGCCVTFSEIKQQIPVTLMLNTKSQSYERN